jgi:pSer/pThr/pTyr-binding forkhead associated (FHA) protein
VIIVDLGSTNGTFVNGRWISQAEVVPGDRLLLGPLDLLL